MLLAIQNLIEYLNRNYFKDKNIENEVITMTKTLIDPEVEKRGEKRGEHKKAIEVAKNMKTKGMEIKLISEVTGLSEKEIAEA